MKERSHDIHTRITDAMKKNKEDSSKLASLSALERELVSIDGQIQSISIAPSGLAETSLDIRISEASRSLNSLSLRIESTIDSDK